MNLQGWLVGWLFGFNGPMRQYFSLYRAFPQREEERGKKGKMREKMSKQPPPAPSASALGPCPTVVQIVGRPGIGSLPSTLAPPDHPPLGGRVVRRCWVNFQCWGVLLTWITVGQGPTTVLAVGAAGLFGHFFSHLSLLFFLNLSGRRPDID